MSGRILDPQEVGELASDLLAKMRMRQAGKLPPEDPAEAEARKAKQAEEDRLAKAAFDERCWKDRLRRYAPIARWESAWNPNPTEAIAAVDAWLDAGAARHLVLFGGVGCGKTTAAAHAVKRWTKTCDPVAWLMHDQLVSAVLHSYDEKSPRLHKYVVVDDMGRERKPEFADALCDLLDMQDRTILITSNLTTPQFKERYTDARLLDRLNDSCVAVRIKAPSLRSQNGGF